MAEVKQNPVLDYVAMQAKSEADSTKTALAITSQLDAQEQATNAAMIARSAMGNAEATISNEKNALQSAVDGKNADIRKEFGADPTLAGTLSNVWLHRMNDAAEKQYQALDVIKQKQSATLLSDPLGFITAQFTLPADIATHNYYDSQRDIAEKQLNEITSASNANVIANNTAAAKTSKELAIAESDKAVQGAIFDNERLKRESAGDRIRGIVELNNLSDKQVSLALQIHSAQNSDKSLAMQAQNHADMMRLRQDALDAKLEGKANMQATMEQYNAGARRMNKPVFQDITAFTLYYNVNGKNPDFQNIWGQGQDILINGGNSDGVPVAASAGHAALTYASGATNGLKADAVGSFLVDQLGVIKALPNAPKDREAVAAAVNERATQGASAMLREIRPSSPNIYAAPAPSMVLEMAKATTGPFIDSVVRPLVTGPEVQIPDDVMFGKAYDFAKSNGRGGVNAAADDIVKYYKAAALKNNMLNQYKEKGLPAQTSYNVNINGAIVNAMDPIAVRTNIIKNTMSVSGDTPFGFR